MIMKSYHKKQAILVAVFSYIVIMGLFFLMSLQNKWEIGQREYYLWSIGAETLGAILTFCIISILGLRKKIGLQCPGFVYGLVIGSLMLAYSIIYFIINTATYGIQNFIIPNAVDLFLVALMMISVALFEELLFRGLLLNTFLNRFDNTTRNMILCVFFSSILFGSSHFINLIVRPELLVLTLCQAIYTVFAGVFFAAVYLKSKNLWAVIFYHALFDIASTVFYEILSPEILQNLNVHYANSTDQALGQGLFYIVAAIPLLICGLFILQKEGGVQNAN